MEYVIAGIIALVVILIFANVRVVPQATEFVIEFLGKYRATGSRNTCQDPVCRENRKADHAQGTGH